MVAEPYGKILSFLLWNLKHLNHINTLRTLKYMYLYLKICQDLILGVSLMQKSVHPCVAHNENLNWCLMIILALIRACNKRVIYSKSDLDTEKRFIQMFIMFRLIQKAFR